MNARLLVVEDEAPMRIALADILISEGYRVQTAADGEAGLREALEQRPDLILLDVMLPKLDGFAVCAELRRMAVAAPVLMLTAKGQVEDRVTGLDSGADDYLVKPFSTEELLARVRALLRRRPGQRREALGLRLGEVRVDLVRMKAHRGEELLHLTAKEFAVPAAAGRSPRRAGHTAAISGSGVGLRGLPHHPHGGQSHRQLAGQDRAGARTAALDPNGPWGGLQDGGRGCRFCRTVTSGGGLKRQNTIEEDSE